MDSNHYANLLRAWNQLYRVEIPFSWGDDATGSPLPRSSLPEREPGQSLVDYYVAHADHPSIAMFLREVPCRDYTQWAALWSRYPDTRNYSDLLNTQCGCGSPEDYRETIEAALDFLFVRGGDPKFLNDAIQCGSNPMIGEIIIAQIASYVDVPGCSCDAEDFLAHAARYCLRKTTKEGLRMPFLPDVVREVLGYDISDGAMQVVLHHVDERKLADHGTSVYVSTLHEDVVRRYA